MRILIVIEGFPASGKSCTAQRLQRRLGLNRYLSKDYLMEPKLREHSPDPEDYELLTRLRDETYSELKDQVIQRLITDELVVVEANFDRSVHVAWIEDIVKETQCKVVEVHCGLNPEICWERFDLRQQGKERRARGHAYRYRDQYYKLFVEGKKPVLDLNPKIRAAFFRLNMEEESPSLMSIVEKVEFMRLGS